MTTVVSPIDNIAEQREAMHANINSFVLTNDLVTAESRTWCELRAAEGDDVEFSTFSFRDGDVSDTEVREYTDSVAAFEKKLINSAKLDDVLDWVISTNTKDRRAFVERYRYQISGPPARMFAMTGCLDAYYRELRKVDEVTRKARALRLKRSSDAEKVAWIDKVLAPGWREKVGYTGSDDMLVETPPAQQKQQ